MSMHDDIEKVLVSEEQLKAKVAELGAQISKDYEGKNLVLVSNEVFSGGADYVGDTAQYLRALAQVNNAFAARADNVCRVVCGLPVYYKGGEKL